MLLFGCFIHLYICKDKFVEFKKGIIKIMKTTFKTLSLIVLVAILASCNKEDYEPQKYKITMGLSIFAKDGKVGTTTVVEENYNVYTAYAIDSIKATSEEILDMLPAGNFLRTSIDRSYRASTAYKKMDGEVVTYKFPRVYSLNSNEQLYFLKNDEKIAMKSDLAATNYGVIHSVHIDGDQEVFCGFFGQPSYDSYGNSYLAPKAAFYWDGKDNVVTPMLPSISYGNFNGVSCVYKSGDDIYLGIKVDFPIYMKNNETVCLDEENYGEVSQIKIINGDVYAIGFYNKKNEKTSGHTACYWKNEELVELEDNAVAEDIFIDGEDVYVVGSKGNYIGNYKACYWKNKERVMIGV